MSNFNSYFKNIGCKRIVDKFFTGVDIYSEHKITSLDFRIVDSPERPASYYVENGLTATFVVEVLYTVDEDPEVKVSTFEVPKEIDGAFIIDGAYRIASNKLENDYDCRIKITGSGEHIINFDYFRVYDIEKKQLRVKRSDPSQTSIPERGTIIKLENLEKALKNPKYQEHLKLTPRQSLKWQIKLDLDYEPTEITPKLIDEALAFGDDRLRDLVIDKTIESVSQSFMRYVFRGNNGRNYFLTKRNITNYFKKFDRLKDDQESMSRMFYKFFKGSANKSGDENELQVPPGVNAINLESLKSRIVVPDTVAVNSTMLDLIDVADTPINNNTNKQNSLTVSTHITDDGVMFDVYDPEFQVITIPYLEYLNKKVVSSEYVDYETRQLKPNERGEVEVKYRMKRQMVPADGGYDLIDLHPDYRLSSTTRRIPFVNLSDSVRISMGSSMLKQSIPLPHAERPLVDSGNYDDLAGNVLSEKFAYDEGKVKEITEKAVIIELPDGTTAEMPRRGAIKSINDVSVYTEPKVKVGQKVKRGDIITGAVGMEPDTYKAGVNALVLFHAYFGLVNEDALVISRSFADKIASYSIVDLTFPVKNLTAIKWIAPIGTEVKSGDPVLTLWRAVKLDEINRVMQEKLGGIFGNEKISEYTVEEVEKVPNNIESAVVSDVLIQKQLKPKLPSKKVDFGFTLGSEEYIENYKKSMDRQVIYDKYPEYVAANRLEPIQMDPEQWKVVYSVRIRLIKYSPAVVGEKITSRYGGKGVCSTIMPDEKMPLVEDPATGKMRRVEVVMNPYSTVNRKIPAVILENQLGLIAHHLHDKVDELKKTKTGQKQIKPLLKKYYGNRFEGMEVEEIIRQHENSPISEIYYFNVGSYSKYTPELVEGWMDELGLKSQLKTMIPADQLIDWEEVEESLGKEEADKLREEKKGKFQEVDKPLQAGYMTLERLYHIPSYSNKVSSSMFYRDVNPKNGQPIMGRGKYRLTFSPFIE